MTEFSSTLTLTAEGALACGIPNTVRHHQVSEQLSGIVVDQNGAPSEGSKLPVTTAYLFQEFTLPEDYPRGDAIPPLTGVQVFVTVLEGFASTATLDFRLDYYLPGTGWISTAEGTAVGVAADSGGLTTPTAGVWFEMCFDPLNVVQTWHYRWRFGIKGRTPTGVVHEAVDYDGTVVTIGGRDTTVVPAISPSPLRAGQTYPFDNAGVPALLYVEPGSETVYYSEQQGVSHVWYTVPNPFALFGNLRAFGADGVNAILDNETTESVSILFRILAGIGDSGTDFLGNSYRGLVTQSDPSDVATTSDGFWLSKPNPSKFAIENLYFDVRDGQKATVIDRLELDPLTPGVFFNVYYSNDPLPGHDPPTWDRLLWTRVPISFLALRQASHVFPKPITARYIKIEFSHLQARYYAPGHFQKSITYQKHPKWVLDYFLALYANQIDPTQYVSSRNSITYDALDIAFNYYVDDLRERPDAPVVISGATNTSQVENFLRNEPDTASQVDPMTLSRIQTAMRPFLDTPFARGPNFGYILKDYGGGDPATLGNYSTEVIRRATSDITEVSSLDRDKVVVEKNWPVMYFHIPARHMYRTSIGSFEQDRAYFAGVKSIAFTREHYASKSDTPLYIESIGDNINVERSDFERFDAAWVNYVTS